MGKGPVVECWNEKDRTGPLITISVAVVGASQHRVERREHRPCLETVHTMIRIVSGDILLSQAHAIVHGVAPNDPFSSGLAHALRERWPSMYKDFRHYCQSRHPEPGGLWTWSGAGDSHVVNLFTQDGAFGHGAKPGKASLANVNHALKALAAEIVKEGYHSVALPRLATGVGGLAWEDVEPLIRSHLAGLGIPVIVYATYRAGVVADEGLVERVG